MDREKYKLSFFVYKMSTSQYQCRKYSRFTKQPQTAVVYPKSRILMIEEYDRDVSRISEMLGVGVRGGGGAGGGGSGHIILRTIAPS